MFRFNSINDNNNEDENEGDYQKDDIEMCVMVRRSAQMLVN